MLLIKINMLQQGKFVEADKKEIIKVRFNTDIKAKVF